ncbi:hypothetical protein [Fictibacillus norfolkensis]|uniref:Uncharacterized protein n=1 Tax=Fictibacillus norfolkensis TaxID=2762233 RepID=A0ABR8SPA3_9BACL|nr:hypothetical protein [Fictibacillus norfolkensis]MBD7964934.1 hypothetical protein [Fictibacillus norfolkensis]
MEQIRKRKKKRHVILSMIIMSYCLLFMVSKYDTFAWFTTQSYANGKITNAKTTDLLDIHVGNVKYLDNCQVQSSVKITNISKINIPVKLDLLSDSKSKYPKSNVLKPGQSLISETKDSNYLTSCKSTKITYHLFGFQGFVDEEIVIALDSTKMIKPIELPKEKIVEENKKEDPKTEDKQQPEVKVEEPIPTPSQPEQPAAPEQTEPETNTTAPSTEPAPTAPIENPATTNAENSQPATPATQSVGPPSTESKEVTSKDE